MKASEKENGEVQKKQFGGVSEWRKTVSL